MKYVLISKRSHADKNTKRDNKYAFYDWYERDITEGSNNDNSVYFISFTSINKVGINPNSTYSTPIGIYTYPVRDIKPYFDKNTIPFASESPYIQVLKINTDKILDRHYTNSMYKKDIAKLKPIIQENIEKIVYHIEDYYDNVQSNIKVSDFDSFILYVNDYIKTHKNYSKLPLVYKIWDTTYIMAQALSKYDKHLSLFNSSILWNKLLSKILGYDVAIDNGIGFIHSNEPIQAVFFNTKAFKHVDTITNKSTESKNIKTIYEYRDSNKKWIKVKGEKLNKDLQRQLSYLSPLCNDVIYYLVNKNKIELAISNNRVLGLHEIIDDKYFKDIELFYNRIADFKRFNGNVFGSYTDLIWYNGKIYRPCDIPKNAEFKFLELSNTANLENCYIEELKFDVHSNGYGKLNIINSEIDDGNIWEGDIKLKNINCKKLNIAKPYSLSIDGLYANKLTLFMIEGNIKLNDIEVEILELQDCENLTIPDITVNKKLILYDCTNITISSKYKDIVKDLGSTNIIYKD